MIFTTFPSEIDQDRLHPNCRDWQPFHSRIYANSPLFHYELQLDSSLYYSVSVSPMTEPTENPYLAPRINAARGSLHMLRPLWIWAVVSALTSLLGAQQDPIAMILVLAFGLISFCTGTVLASTLHVAIRVLPLVSVAILTFSYTAHDTYIATAAVCYGLLCVGMGAWACKEIRFGHLRILSSFCGGYAFGSIPIALTTTIGAIWATTLGAFAATAIATVAAIYAKRSLGMQNPNP
jgi:hypothetical protein